MIKTVIFDIDQTLYDYHACHAIAIRRIDEYCQSVLSWENGEVIRLWRIIYLEVCDKLGFDNANIHDTMLRIQMILERKGVNPLPYARELHLLYWDTVVEHMKLFDWVKPFIREAKAEGITLGVATDLTVEIQFRKLEKLGLLQDLDFIVTSEEAGCEKPHRGIFEDCLKKAGCKPEECVMIGDNWDKDIVGAQEMGMHYIWHEAGKEVRALHVSQLMNCET